MNVLLYLISIALIISWAVGFFAYGVGAVIHLLLLIAGISLLLTFVNGNDNTVPGY